MTQRTRIDAAIGAKTSAHLRPAILSLPQRADEAFTSCIACSGRFSFAEAEGCLMPSTAALPDRELMQWNRMSLFGLLAESVRRAEITRARRETDVNVPRADAADSHESSEACSPTRKCAHFEEQLVAVAIDFAPDRRFSSLFRLRQQSLFGVDQIVSRNGNVSGGRGFDKRFPWSLTNADRKRGPFRQ